MYVCMYVYLHITLSPSTIPSKTYCWSRSLHAWQCLSNTFFGSNFFASNCMWMCVYMYVFAHGLNSLRLSLSLSLSLSVSLYLSLSVSLLLSLSLHMYFSLLQSFLDFDTASHTYMHASEHGEQQNTHTHAQNGMSTLSKLQVGTRIVVVECVYVLCIDFAAACL